MSYNPSSTEPAWKYLFAYEFVPSSFDEDGCISVYEDDLAKITMNGKVLWR